MQPLSIIVLAVAGLGSLAAASPAAGGPLTPRREEPCGSKKCPDGFSCFQDWDQDKQEWKYKCCTPYPLPDGICVSPR